MQQRHGERIKRNMLLEPPCLSLFGRGPREQFHGVAVASLAFDALWAVLD
jgi:hypothetical protein